VVSLIDIVRLLRNQFPSLNIYPLEYPLNSPDNAVLVDMQSTNPAKAGVFSVNVQLKVRETHPTLGEATSYQLRSFLENKTNFTLGEVQVIMVQSVNPVPLYMGKDGSGRYLYSNNFRFIMNEGGTS
jgi:hypothetical protein